MDSVTVNREEAEFPGFVEHSGPKAKSGRLAKRHDDLLRGGS